MSVDPIEFVLSKQRRIGGLLLPRHNMTNAGRFRAEFFYGNDFTGLKWDSGWQYAWPKIYSIRDVDYESDNYWTRNVRNEDRALFNPLAIAIADTNHLVGSGRIYLDDPYNPAGVFNLGRVVLPTIWQPTTNMDLGSAFGSVFGTQMERVLDGTKYFDRKGRERSFSCVLSRLSKDEAFLRLQHAYQTQGVDREVFICDDLTIDKSFMYRAFMGHFVNPSPVSHPLHFIYSGAVALEEFT